MSFVSALRAVLCVVVGLLTAGAAQRAETEISGSVRWPDGRAAEGVTVSALLDPGLEVGFELDLGTHRATTDADGRFRIRRVGEGAWIVRAKIAAPGAEEPGVVRWPWCAELRGVAPGARDVALVLAEGSAVRGRAVDDRGEPLKSVRVELKHVDRFEGEKPMGWETRTVAVATAAGNFEIRGLEPGAWLVTVDSAEHVAAPEARFDMPASAPPREFVLTRGARVRGVVVDAQGKPVAGARVGVLRPGEEAPHLVDGPESNLGLSLGDLVTDPFPDTTPTAPPAPAPIPPPGPRAAVSDASGRFEIFAARPGKGVLRADAIGHARSVPREIELAPAAELADVRIALRRGATLRGVVRAPNGAPLEAVDVLVLVDGGARWTVTDAYGRYRFEHVMPGRVVLAAFQESVPGAITQLTPGKIELDVTLHEGEDVEVPIGGPPSTVTRVRGVVRGALSVANAKVRFEPTREGAPFVETRTDADGKYALELAERGEYWIILHLPSDSLAERRIHVSDAEEQVFDFELPGTLLRGRVVDTTGAPVRARIRVRRTDLESSLDGAWSTVGTDDTLKDGSYVFEGLERGPWRVSVTPKGGALARRHLVVDLAREPRMEGFVVTLAAGGSVEGLVRRADGKPAAGARVTARGEDGFDHDHETPAEERLTTDAAGRFRIDGLSPGTWRVRAVDGDSASRESAPLAVASGAVARAEVLLERAGFVEVALEDAQGVALRHGPAEATRVYDADGRPWNDLEEERFGEDVRRFGPLPAGRWFVRRGDATRFPAVEVEVRADEGRRVVLRAKD